MITLLGTLIGFGTSFLPEVLAFFRKGQEHKHHLERMKLEYDMMERRSDLKLAALDKKADIEETKGLYQHDQSLDSGRFINALRGSVRPVLTYSFFILFLAVQGVIMMKVIESGGDWKDGVEVLWSDNTQALFSSILAFWFGNRAVSKYMRIK